MINEDDITNRVKITEYTEKAAYQVAAELNIKGYLLANSIGMRTQSPCEDAIGILKAREPVRKGLLGILGIKSSRRALNLGILWISNEARKANYGSNWVLEAYGRENLPELKELADDLSMTHNVDIEIRLETEDSRLEKTP